MGKKIFSKPITIKMANDFIKKHHRHHRPTSNNSGKFAVSAYDELNNLVGVVIAGNPVSANFMDGTTLEITRLCVIDVAPKGTPSFLISKCSRIWRIMGGTKLITYTLDKESGASLRWAGWKIDGIVEPHNNWYYKSKSDGKKRDKLKIYSLKKIRWVYKLK